jgi:hypothetical protein
MIADIDRQMEGRRLRDYADRWCYLGGGSQTTTTKNETDPQIKALMLQNYSDASNVANTPFQPYTGQRVAGFTPNQIAGQGGLLAAANDPSGTNGLTAAAGSVGGLLGYRPPNIAAPSTITPNTVTPGSVAAGQLSSTDLAPYMNPFTKDVINQTIEQQKHARDMQGVTDNASATAAHAFGGTRQAVQRALTTEGYDRNTGGLIAGLNADNFTQARGAASTDIGNRLAADQFNVNNRMGADEFNATGKLGADQFNATGGYNAGVANAGNDITGANFRLNAGKTLAGLSDQELQDALTRAGVINAVGDQQHSQQQDVNDAAYEEFLRQIGYPAQQQSIKNAAIGLLPNDGTQTGTTQKKYGLGDFLMAGISGASKAAAGGAFG